MRKGYYENHSQDGPPQMGRDALVLKAALPLAEKLA
jgi:hypothetical protein